MEKKRCDLCLGTFLRLVAAAYRAKHPSYFNAQIEAMYADAVESTNLGGEDAVGDAPVRGADDDAADVVAPPALVKLLDVVRTNTYLPAMDLEARLPTWGALKYHFLDRMRMKKKKMRKRSQRIMRMTGARRGCRRSMTASLTTMTSAYSGVARGSHCGEGGGGGVEWSL